MKISTISLFLYFSTLTSLSFAAQIDNASGPNQTQSCAVRLSNSSLKGGDSGIVDQEFCSGTMTSPTRIVTGAHCLNMISSSNIDLANIKNHPSFQISVGSSDSSQQVNLDNGNKSFASPAMAKKAQRQSYIEHGNGSLINDDLVVVTLVAPVAELSGRACPRLPTESDCAAFNLELTSAAAAHPARSPDVSAFYFASRIVKSGDNAGATKSPALTSQIYLTRANEIAFRGSYVAMTFIRNDKNGTSKVVHLLKGDSGTTANWNSSTGPVIIGVQSGVLNDSHAGFAQVCSHIKSPEWIAALGPAVGVQTASQESSAGAVNGSTTGKSLK